MSQQPTPEQLGLQAFPNDFDYLAAELEWIGARVQRIASQQWLDELKARQVEQGIREHIYTGRITPERVAFLRAEEDAIRQSIDTRLGKNRTDGPDLGLDRLCREHGLGDVERNLLLLGYVPCLGIRHSRTFLWRLSPDVMSPEVSIESVASLMELPPEESVKALRHLLPETPLLKLGLISVTYEPETPVDALKLAISLTGRCLAEMTGVPAFKGFCAWDERDGSNKGQRTAISGS